MREEDFAPLIPVVIFGIMMLAAYTNKASNWGGRGINNSVWPLMILLMYLAIIASSIFAAYILIKHYDEHLWIFHGYTGIIFYTAVGLALYKLRKNKRLLYGLLEVSASIATYYYTVFAQSNLDAKLIGLLGGGYLMVRGLDNMRTDLPDEAHQWWDKWIG